MPSWKAARLKRAILAGILLSMVCLGELSGRPGPRIRLEVIRYFPTKIAMLVEAYAGIPLQAMKYERSSGGKSAYHLTFEVDLFDQDHKRLYHDTWNRDGEVDRQYASSDRAYILEPILSVPLDIGRYELKIAIHDQISGNGQEFW